MNKQPLPDRTKLTPAVIVTAAALVALLASATSSEPPDESIAMTDQAIRNANIETAATELRALTPGFEASGSVQLNEEHVYTIVPRIAGIVADSPAALGDTVAKGTPLVRLESRELADSFMAYIESEHRLGFSREALTREKALFERNVSSREMLQEKELEFKQAELAHTAALQPLELLHFEERRVHELAENLGRANLTALDITAPAAGEIIEKQVELGASVAADAPLFRIADMETLWVDFHVSLREAGLIAPGMKVAVRSSLGEREDTAEVIYVAPFADPSTRRVMARALLPNPGESWRPGAPVTVALQGGARDEILSVPASALVDIEGKQVVFVQESERSFLPTEVVTGMSDGEFVEVRSGLAVGLRVVTRNAAQLKAQWQMEKEG